MSEKINPTSNVARFTEVFQDIFRRFCRMMRWCMKNCCESLH